MLDKLPLGDRRIRKTIEASTRNWAETREQVHKILQEFDEQRPVDEAELAEARGAAGDGSTTTTSPSSATGRTTW